MKIIVHILLAVLSFTLYSQNTQKIEILNADNTYANAKKHPDYWRLIGNVNFMHNNAIMECDSAYHFSESNKIKAFGKIRITKGDSIILTGKYLTYLGKENIVDLKGNVILIDKYMKLKTDKILYNLKNNIALYSTKGVIIDSEKVITSNVGKYLASTHYFIFSDSVTVEGKDYNIMTEKMHYNSNNEITYFFGPTYIKSETKTIYCENGWYNTTKNISQFKQNAYITTRNYILKGDSLFYNQNLGYGKAINNVELIDTTESMTVFGGLAEYFENNEKVKVSKNPLLQILLQQDTLFMHAQKFISKTSSPFLSNKKKGKVLIAYNKVKFFKNDFQGKCDSLSYNFNDSLMEMYKNPILWSNNYQLTSDSLEFLIYEGKISQMLLSKNPMIISKEDSLDYNQIKGKKITAYFTDNDITKMNVKGNGQSVFIVKDEATQEKIGINYTECTDLTLYFKDNKLKTVNYEIKPTSITTPYFEVDKNKRFLKGFKWRGIEQPKRKEDIFY